MKKKVFVATLVLILTLATLAPAVGAPKESPIGVNVLISQDINQRMLADLSAYGSVKKVFNEIDALTMRTTPSGLAAILKLPFVKAAGVDAVRNGAPIDTLPAVDFSAGISTWDLDAINVTDNPASAVPGDPVRIVPYDGAGVYVAVLDTGLLDSWRKYFPQERIAAQYAKSFGGGGGTNSNVSEQPNKWEHDQNSHGTHVTSSILGYDLRGTQVNGAAPLATVIPVKVLNQNGSGWSSVIAEGIIYVANLKLGPLAESPVIINMSLGGSLLDPVEKAAIDYAIEAGVIIVASAGNEGLAGMGYPGAYGPVISVASAGWNFAGQAAGWWKMDVPEDDWANQFFISDFSSVAKPGQDLDVTAPGDMVVGPYQVNSGQMSYYYLSGTSMASPHVAGLVALLAEKNPGLTAAEAEALLEGTAKDIGAGPDCQGAGMVDALAALGM